MLRLVLIVLIAYRTQAVENVRMERAKIQDQESSASSYAYQVQSGTPMVYARTGLPLKEEGIQAGASNLEGLQQYPYFAPYHQGLLHYKPQALGLLQPYAQPGLAAGQHLGGLQVHPYALHYHPLPQIQPILPVKAIESEKFEKGGGSAFNEANKAAHGEKGSTGYQSAQQYDKAAKGEHDKEGHQEQFHKEGGHKKGHHEAGGHYGQQEQAAKGSQGQHFAEQKSHKKGSKTSGYHKVHHKDEYKKDHSFYDESDASGHFAKHGDFDAHQAAEKGGFEKGGHQQGGYEEGEKGAKGFVNKGHFDEKDSGFKGKAGKEAFYKNFEEFGKKGGEQEGKEFGFSEKKGLHEQF